MLAVQLTVADPEATDVIVTVCVLFAFADVKVSVAGETVACAVAEDTQLTVTPALGMLPRATVNDSECPPAVMLYASAAVSVMPGASTVTVVLDASVPA